MLFGNAMDLSFLFFFFDQSFICKTVLRSVQIDSTNYSCSVFLCQPNVLAYFG